MNKTKFLLSLPIDLKKRLQEHATEKNLTLTSYIRMILSERERIHRAPKVNKEESTMLDKRQLAEIKGLIPKF